MSLQRFLDQIRRGADGGSTSGDSSGEAEAESLHVTPGRLEAELRRRAAVKQARGLLGEAGFAAAAEEMAREEVEAAKVARRNAALTRQRREALSAFLQAHHAGDPRRGLEAWLLDAGAVDEGATVSAAAQAQGLAAKYLGGLLADLQRADLIPELNYGHLERRVVRALWDLEEGKKTGAAKARDRSARQTREVSSVEPGAAAPADSELPQRQPASPQAPVPAANGASPSDNAARPDIARTDTARENATGSSAAHGGTTVIGPGEVAALSKILAKYDRAARLEAEAAGAWVKPLPGYVLRQSHDADRIRFAGFRAWRDFLAERLDERTFEGVRDRERYLRRVYDALSRGAQHLLLGASLRPIALDEMGGDEDGERARAWMQAVARLLTNDRLLHFKSADAWFDYLERFGAGTLNEALLFGLERLGRTTGLMRALGPNPQESLDKALQDLTADTKGRRKARLSLKVALARLDGSMSLPADGIAARVAAGAEAQRAFSRIGSLMAGRITQAPDGAARLETRRAGAQSRGLLSELERDLTKLIASRRTREARQELAAMLSVFHEAMVRSILARSEAADGYPGTAGRLLRYRLKLDGGAWWDESLRGAVAQAVSHRLARNKTLEFDALEPALQSELGFHEIGAEDWPTLRKSARRLADGRDYVTPEAVPDGPESELGRKLSDYLTERSALALFEDAEAPRPLAPLSAIGTLLGGAELVLLRYSERFAVFPLAASQNREGQAILRQGDNEVAKALTNGHGEILGLAQLLMWSALFGHGAKRAPEIAEEIGDGSGEDGRRQRDDAAWRQAWRDAMTQGGGLGLYSDFLLDLIARRLDGRPLAALAGPVLQDSGIADLPEFARRLRNSEAAAADALAALLEREDFATVFFARFGLDNLFLQHVLEAASPGVRQRLARRAREAERQDFFFTPSRVG